MMSITQVIHDEISQGANTMKLKPLILLHRELLRTEHDASYEINSDANNIHSGIRKRMFNLSVTNDVVKFQLVVDWAKFIREMTKVHVKWLRSRDEHNITSYKTRWVALKSSMKERSWHELKKIPSCCLFILAFAVFKIVLDSTIWYYLPMIPLFFTLLWGR